MSEKDKIKISRIEIYHPETVRDNEYYMNYFAKKGIAREESRHMLEEVLCRDKRYVIEENSGENTLTMATKAAKKVLKSLNITGAEIDMICLATLSPEYTIPPTALHIHDAIGARKHSICFDINLNCIGMPFCIDLLSRYMCANDNIKKVLLIGSEYLTYLVQPDDFLHYGAFGDLACALVLEKTEGESCLLDTAFLADSAQVNIARAPGCGYSHLLDSTPEQIMLKGVQCKGNLEEIVSRVIRMIRKNNLSISDIKVFCVSQFCKAYSEQLCESLNIEQERVPYYGDKYGYTGCSSPLLVLYESIKAGKVKRGDYVFIWTAGYAMQESYLLLKY